MYPFPDPPYLFDRSFIGHHEVMSPPPPPPPPSPSKPDPSSLFPFSPPTFSHDSIHDLLLTTQHLLPTNTSTLTQPPPVPPPAPPLPPPDLSERRLPSTANKNTKTTVPAKRSGVGTGRKRGIRKDRHSKIFTAQGPRDRRMRLSLDVARKFFHLQDILGFDKASKTVEWLLTKSKSAIKEIAAGCSSSPPRRGCSSTGNACRSEASTSECEVISVSTAANVNDKKFAAAAASAAADEVSTAPPPPPPKAKRVAIRASSRRAASHNPTLARESRTMARAWARERTSKKRIWSTTRRFEDGCSQTKQLVSSSSPFETTGEESGTHDMKSSLELVAEVVQPSSYYSPHSHQEKSDGSLPAMLTGESAGLISIFDYNHNIVHSSDTIKFFQEHWNMPQSGNNIEDQRVLLADVRFQARPWEAFNNSYV